MRRPEELFIDEITVTRGAIGPHDAPSLMRRWGLLNDMNYTQVLGVKRFGRVVAGSVEYDRQIGSNILRGAVTLRFDKSAPISDRSLRAIPAHQSKSRRPASASGRRGPVSEHVRVQGGYVRSISTMAGGTRIEFRAAGTSS